MAKVTKVNAAFVFWTAKGPACYSELYFPPVENWWGYPIADGAPQQLM